MLRGDQSCLERRITTTTNKFNGMPTTPHTNLFTCWMVVSRNVGKSPELTRVSFVKLLILLLWYDTTSLLVYSCGTTIPICKWSAISSNCTLSACGSNEEQNSLCYLTCSTLCYISWSFSASYCISITFWRTLGLFTAVSIMKNSLESVYLSSYRTYQLSATEVVRWLVFVYDGDETVSLATVSAEHARDEKARKTNDKI